MSNAKWALDKETWKTFIFPPFLLMFRDFAITEGCGDNLFTPTQTCWHLSVKKKKNYLSSGKNIGMTFTNTSSCQQVRFHPNCELLRQCELWKSEKYCYLSCFAFFKIFITIYLSVLISKISWAVSLIPHLMCTNLPLNNSGKKKQNSGIQQTDGIGDHSHGTKDTTIP